LVALSICVAATAILHFQQIYIDNQSDVRLERLSVVAETIISESENANSDSQIILDALWEGYIGVFESDGSLTNVLTPVSDPLLRPAVDLYSASVEPQTVSSSSGRAKHVRTKTVALEDGRVALIGLIMTEGNNVIAQLRVTFFVVGMLIFLLLGIVLWWIYRLGLRPIRNLTRDADEIALGLKRRTVETGLHRAVETAQLEQSINRALDVSQNAELTMRRFLADVSHELRTPLTCLQGYSALYFSGGLTTTEQVSDAMMRIQAESIRMSKLVNDLLTLNGLEVDESVTKEPVQLAVVLGHVKSDVLAAHPERTIDVDCDESIEVLGDGELIFQAVLNLAANAIRHTTSGTHVTLGAQSLNGSVRISVSDTGAGIPAEHLPHIFERFYRVDHGRDSGSGGSGLGLAIVAHIMKIHGGTYGVISVEGKGTEFWIEFTQ
jgi:two-component system OmpR family sensor kinase